MSSLMTPYIQEGYSTVRAEAIFGRSSVLGSGASNYDGLYREASVEALFGPASERGDGGIFDNMVYGLGDEPLFHILLVVTLVAYLYMLLRSWKFIRSIHIDVLENRSEQRLIAEGGVLPLQRFKQVATTIGLLLIALVGVRAADLFVAADSPIFSPGIAPVATIVALLFVGVFVAWFYALHKVAEWVSSMPEVQMLASVVQMSFVRGVVLLYPFVAVWLLADGESFTRASVVAVVAAAPIAVLYLKDTFLFFIEKKIPILYWILYLCTAILLPLSFVARLL